MNLFNIYLRKNIYFISDFKIYYFHNGDVLLKISEKKIKEGIQNHNAMNDLINNFSTIFTKEKSEGESSIDEILKLETNLKGMSEV